MDVGAWLRGLGLGQYETTFRESEIDAEVLLDLTEGDLNQLGVPLGHRKRLLKAIAALGAFKTAAKASKPTAAPSPTAAERRPITVMFCDLVGSTSLAAKLDAEDWRNLVNAYLDEASGAVIGLGGHVLKKLGDGLMALFGYPYAQENDAERAVRAALAIQLALADLNARNARSGAPQLSARIGIECGSVVVDAAGEVFGEAPNLAARVQAAAEPGTVLITASVQRQTAGLFVVEDKGAHELKGVTAPAALYRVVRASGGGRRGGARALTPLVGREDELALLTRRWSRALEGEGQFVQIVGEPGIGKSRLVEEFRAKLAETPHTWAEWAASQLLQNTPLHPLAEWGRLRFGGADATDEGRLADLENTLRLVGLDPNEYAPLIAPLVDIPLPEERSAKFAPEELRRRQLAAVMAWYFAGARTQPAVLVFEDLHWADPTSLDLMRSLVERGAQAPLLIVATTRPEFRPPWAMRSHHGVVSLAPLDRAQVRRMVGEIASRHALSDEVIDGVGERTGGVPLFVEEVTRLLLERDVHGGAQAIPPTLQQSLAARLDRLGEAREVAQIGAVLGRDFTYLLLRDVAEADEPTLQASLDRLADADLLFVDGAPPQANYRFKHALIQDAAYESLLKGRRQALHRRAAELLRDDPERTAAGPEVIAHHFLQAGLDDFAIEWWGKAGDIALRRSAFKEAIAHLGKAIEMSEAAAVATEKPGAKLKLQVSYGNAVMAARGYTSPETRVAFERARELATGVEGVSERLSVYYGLWIVSHVRGELGAMRELADAFFQDHTKSPDPGAASVANRILGATKWFAGAFVEARAHLERAVSFFDPELGTDMTVRFGHDIGISAIGYSAFALWPLGEIDLALRRAAQLAARADKPGHALSAGVGYGLCAMFAMLGRDAARAKPFILSASKIGDDHEMALIKAISTSLDGWVASRSGQVDASLLGLRQGIARLREEGVVVWSPLFETVLAEAEAEVGEIEAAVATIDHVLVESKRTGQRWHDAESHRVRGEILLKQNPADPAPAEEAYLTAIGIAQQQKTRSFELRAALALAKLYRATGRDADAHAALAPALEGFAPTPEMPEIADAQALLAALAETEEVKADARQRRRLTQLQTAYGNALLQARGYGAPETTEAFARARESASDDKDGTERLAADYGVWGGSYVRGDLPSMREHGAAFLRDVEARPDSPEASVAQRAAGNTCWFAGEYREARDHFERALTLFQPGRDDDLAFRFGWDPGVAAMANLAMVSWPLGEVDRATSLNDRMQTRIADLTHVGTLAPGRTHAALFELMRGDRVRAAPNALELARLAREHDLPMYRAFGVFLEGWATAARGAIGGGLDDMRRGVELLREQNVLWFDGLLKIVLAETEARAGDPHRAVAALDDALATCDRTGYRAFEAELHRARGEMLLNRDPVNPTPAEEAFQTAIAVAKRQGTRSFELRATLALAKLYQSTTRPAEAHAVLAPALEGFEPTTEMPEIAEAQALLTALAATDQVKVEAAHRQRLTQLHVSYGNALIATRGYGAPETTRAFARARESASADKDGAERLAADYGVWVGSYTRGELPEMQAHAATFLADVETTPDSPEASGAHRAAGITCWFAGEYAQARDHLERALALFQPGRDDDLAFRFGQDPGVVAMTSLAIAVWPLGEVDRAISLIDRMHTRMAGLTHVGTLALGRMHATMFELMRGDHARGAPNAVELVRLTGEQELPMFRAYGVFLEGWASTVNGTPGRGLDNMRRGVEQLREQNILPFDGLLKIALAEAEAAAGNLDRALAVLDEALAASDRMGFRAFEAELHRGRGETLLICDPANPAPVEVAFLTAIAVAKQQGTRSFGLRAALSLAKLYRATGRDAEAHAVLASALQGFSPTPEMPEIAQAQALLAALAETEQVKAAEAQRQRRAQLHVAYGNALIGARGHGAPETIEAFAKARDSAYAEKGAPERFAADYGLYAGAYTHGELAQARAHAETLLRNVAERPDSPEAGVAHRAIGLTRWVAGEYREAQHHLERALALFQPGRDDDLAFRFGWDAGVGATIYLAIVLWPMGDVERAVSLVRGAQTRIAGLSHIGTHALVNMHAALFELMRDNFSHAAPYAVELARIAREHDLPMWRAFGLFLEGAATTEGRTLGEGLTDMRRGVELMSEENDMRFAGLIKIALAEAEARAGDVDRSLAILDEALATCERIGQRAFEAELHRVRGDMLLKHDPAHPASAEAAFGRAIEVAAAQGTRSFSLRAALALAKLFQSAGRAADADAVLAPALEGFSPMPEMPEIAEAMSLLARLA